MEAREIVSISPVKEQYLHKLLFKLEEFYRSKRVYQTRP